MELPTVEQLHTFMETINKGRVACGLEPIERLDYDACTPGSTDNCLSARHLFCAVDPVAGVSSVEAGPYETQIGEPLNAALEGGKPLNADARYVRIPDSILVVTDAFDGQDYLEDEEYPAALRARFVEAGLVCSRP